MISRILTTTCALALTAGAAAADYSLTILHTNDFHARFEPITLPLAETLNRVVAVVNDDVILESELSSRETMIVDQLRQQQAQLPSRPSLRKQVLDRLVLENLQLQLAERSGIRVDDETLNSNLRNLAKQNGMTLTEFREVLEKDGFDYAAFREEFRDQIIMNRVRQEMVDKRVQVTEQEVDQLLASAASFNDQDREYRLAHILVSVPEAASPEQVQAARKRAEDILSRLSAGADFEQIAIAEAMIGMAASKMRSRMIVRSACGPSRFTSKPVAFSR